MTEAPSGSPAQLSEDGKWWWDGSQWQAMGQGSDRGAGQSAPHSPTSFPGDTDTAAADSPDAGVWDPNDPTNYSEGPSAEAMVAAGIAGHTGYELLHNTPAGVAAATAELESDNPGALQARRDQEFEWGIQDRTDEERAAQMNDNLPHVIPMDAPAEREQAVESGEIEEAEFQP